MKVNIEVTDTFGHEPNYSWVKRESFDMPDSLSNYAIIRRVKHAIGWNGKRCLTNDFGDTIELRPYGECQVAFVTFGG